jgi:hypothetical protein
MTLLESLLAFLPRPGLEALSNLQRNRHSDRDACRHELMAMEESPGVHFPDEQLPSLINTR